MSLIDDVKGRLYDKYNVPKGRVPSANEVLASVYDAESGSLNISGGVTSTSVTTIWTGTQAEYDAIVSPDSATLYVVVEP